MKRYILATLIALFAGFNSHSALAQTLWDKVELGMAEADVAKQYAADIKDHRKGDFISLKIRDVDGGSVKPEIRFSKGKAFAVILTSPIYRDEGRNDAMHQGSANILKALLDRHGTKVKQVASKSAYTTNPAVTYVWQDDGLKISFTNEVNPADKLPIYSVIYQQAK